MILADSRPPPGGALRIAHLQGSYVGEGLTGPSMKPVQDCVIGSGPGRLPSVLTGITAHGLVGRLVWAGDRKPVVICKSVRQGAG